MTMIGTIELRKNGEFFLVKQDECNADSEILELIKENKIEQYLFYFVRVADDIVLEDLIKVLKKYPILTRYNNYYAKILEEYEDSRDIERKEHPIIKSLFLEKHVIEMDETIEIHKGITGIDPNNAEISYSIYFEYMEDILDLPLEVGNLINYYADKETGDEYCTFFNYYDLNLTELLNIILVEFGMGNGRENKKAIREEGEKQYLEDQKKKSRFKVLK